MDATLLGTCCIGFRTAKLPELHCSRMRNHETIRSNPFRMRTRKSTSLLIVSVEQNKNKKTLGGGSYYVLVSEETLDVGCVMCVFGLYVLQQRKNHLQGTLSRHHQLTVSAAVGTERMLRPAFMQDAEL